MDLRQSKNSDDAEVEQAAAWFARMHAPQVPGETAKAFEAWLAASANNAQAYARVRRFWNAAPALIEELSSIDLVGDAEKARPKWPLLAGIAAALLITAVASLAVIRFAAPPPPDRTAGLAAASPVEEADYSTTLNRSSVALPDGSIVVLNAGSAIRMRYSADRPRRHPPARAGAVRSGQAPAPTLRGLRRRPARYGDRHRIRRKAEPASRAMEVTLMEGSVLVDMPVERSGPHVTTKLVPGNVCRSSRRAPDIAFQFRRCHRLAHKAHGRSSTRLLKPWSAP